MANLQSTTINDTGFIQLPKGPTNERPASPSPGMVRYNTTLDIVEYYDSDLSLWLSLHNLSPLITGGTVNDATINGSQYRIHEFVSGNTTVTVTRSGIIDYLIVGGGGGGSRGGGGGAGGVLLGRKEITTGTYTVIVGSGGSADIPIGQTGGISSAFGITAFGGGGGSEPDTDPAGGGSGGGAGYAAGSNQDTPFGGLGTPGQGNNGAAAPWLGTRQGSGGGGGAGENGLRGEATGSSAVTGGAGGSGISSDISGSVQFYGGGGGGGDISNAGGGPGGFGGGGKGATRTQEAAQPGVNGTGGGGGGGSSGGSFTNGANGGSGIVIVRYKLF